MREHSTEGRLALDELTRSGSGLEELWRKLRLHTHAKFGYLVRRRFNLDEVVLEAIEDTYFGERQLPPDVDLFFFLSQTIRSKVSHLLEKEKRRRKWNLSFEEVEVTQPQVHLSKPFGLPEQRPQFAERNVEAYRGVAYQELCGRIVKVATEPDLRRVAELLFATPDLKPGEIAEQLNLPVKSIRNLLRRLGRKARGKKRD
jgi:DNA-directed RNA polymerase specialized sigma24 family protein